MVVAPPSSVPRGPSPPSRSRRVRKLRARLAKYTHSMTETSSQSELAGPSSQQAAEPSVPPSQPNPSTSQGIPDP